MLAPLLVSAALLLAGASGVRGTVLIDPAFPVCAAGRPCTAPDPHETLVFWRGPRRAAVTTTGADGRFRVALAPGLYRITLPRRALGRSTPVPAQVRVPRGRYVAVVLHVDVGIR